MEIRRAKEGDIEGCLTLIKEFQEESLNYYNLLCDEAIARALMKSFVNTSFVLEERGEIKGVLGGLVVSYPLNNEKIYQEHIWFVDKAYRKYGVRLYLAMERWCEENQIKKIVMVSMGNSKFDKLEQFYKRLGFMFLESHFLKDLKCQQE